MEIVKLIFSNRIAGIGKGMTAQKLNELAKTNPAFTPWELDAGKRAAPKMWSATYVGRVLRNRAVMGEWQPYTRPRKGEPAPAGEPIEDYYPRIIDPATFARANEERIKDALKHQGRGRGLSNLLGTRARCGSCGGQMSALGSAAYFINKKGEKRRHYFLYCTASKVAKTCDNARGWTYDRVEGPLLDAILNHAMDDQHFASDNGETAALEGAVYGAKAAVGELQRKLNNLLDVVESGNKAAIVRYQQREIELDTAKLALAKAENDLSQARGKVSPAEHLRRVSEVQGMMWDDDPDIRYQARLKVKQALADIIESIKFFKETGNVAVMLVDRMRRIGINHAGEIIDDIDLTMVDPTVGPGYGRVMRMEDGEITYENDLIPDQAAGSKAYVRRRAKAE
nr:recombinase family protein [Sphingomonas sp. CFBP 8760]